MLIRPSSAFISSDLVSLTVREVHSCTNTEDAIRYPELVRAPAPSSLHLLTCVQDFPGSNFSAESWGLDWISDHASCTFRTRIWMCADVRSAAAQKAGKTVILEEFGVTGLGTCFLVARIYSLNNLSATAGNKSTVYTSWVQRALDTNHA